MTTTKPDTSATEEFLEALDRAVEANPGLCKTKPAKRQAATRAKAEAPERKQAGGTEAEFYDVRDIAKLCTDTGNAARLVMRHGENIRWCDPWGKWLIWNGQRWEPDSALKILGLSKETALSIYDEARQAAASGTADKALSRWADRSQERGRLDAMIALARPDVAVSPEELDHDSYLLNVENCTIDLRTGKARPHDRKDMLTKIAPVNFDPRATCPRWLKFLGEIFAGNRNVIDYLQRVAGLCCTADASEQCLFIFFGSGANGKSTFLDTLTALLGDYAGESAPDLLLSRRDDEHPAGIADLCGKRFVAVSETREGRHLRAELVKRLTGNARLKARFMRQDFFEFQRTFKLALATNNRPRISENTHAIWRRIKLVPFDVVIPDAEQDKDLLRKLRDEFSGILNWCIEGCLAWQREGLGTPDEVTSATLEYRAAEDVLADFFADCCVFDSFAYVRRGELFKAYEQWAEGQGEKHPLGLRSFYERVRQRPGIGETAKKVTGQSARVFTGLALKVAGCT